MWGWVVLPLVVIVMAAMLFKSRRSSHRLKDKKNFDAYVAKNKLSIVEQIELCEKFHLDHQIGHRSYDSVEDWEKELTAIWIGKSSDIEFTYRKYDEKERRTISPTEFGFDGNEKAYIRGVCRKSDEPRTFKVARIDTKIKVGSKRYELNDWLESCLGVDPEKLKKPLNN
ncbi:WYL domain-containing protein [Vibrio chagasii]|nr:WYL domain-containing protein [Vibrio chagasii]CAH7278529.1 WYL domain-containing protein [Vibrio chagasii]CAH7320979.1 WYL domain-containing protein [Vibrio chagasii]CAH7339909.1 WYL domain-containing protein [Vibrio chagasii]CAH7368695.1 WYL domain-containing protein [Vibrio chagasii]